MRKALSSIAILIVLFALFVPIVPKAIPRDSWSPVDFQYQYAKLHGLAQEYESNLLKNDMIPKKQLVMKLCDSQLYESISGITHWGHVYSSSVVVGYVLNEDLPSTLPLDEGNIITMENFEEVKKWYERKLTAE